MSRRRRSELGDTNSGEFFFLTNLLRLRQQFPNRLILFHFFMFSPRDHLNSRNSSSSCPVFHFFFMFLPIFLLLLLAMSQGGGTGTGTSGGSFGRALVPAHKNPPPSVITSRGGGARVLSGAGDDDDEDGKMPVLFIFSEIIQRKTTVSR